MAASVTLPVVLYRLASWGRPEDANALLGFGLLVAALLLFAHRTNLGNLREGREPTVGS